MFISSTDIYLFFFFIYIQEDLQSTLNKMKVKLEKETVGHLEANQKIAELEYRINELNLMVCSNILHTYINYFNDIILISSFKSNSYNYI